MLAAATGATLAELMARLGHSTVSAAMRYQHAAADRDKVIAAALSDLAAGTVTPISKAKSKRRAASAPGFPAGGRAWWRAARHRTRRTRTTSRAGRPR